MKTPSAVGTHSVRVTVGDDGYVPLLDIEAGSQPKQGPFGLVQPRTSSNRLLVRPTLGEGTGRPSSLTAGACVYVGPYDCRGAGVTDLPLPGRGVRAIAIVNVLPVDPVHPSIATCAENLVLVESPIAQVLALGAC